MTDVRESLMVELVDETGKARGTTTVELAHQSPGLLHRAFSVVILDTDNRILLQQRAAVKTRFALRWANACCGHPEPGASVVESALKRLAEEMGAGPVDLTELGVYEYYAEDEESGRVEYEYDHILLARVPVDGLDLDPNPDEVAAVAWTPMDELLPQMQDDPASYAPWLRGAVNLVLNRAGSA